MRCNERLRAELGVVRRFYAHCETMSNPTDEIIRIVANGGGVMVDASKPTDDLIRIAANAAGKATAIIRDAARKPTDELIWIAANGKGSIIFDLL